MVNTHTHTYTTFVKATSIGIAHLVIKALELSLVPPGGRFLMRYVRLIYLFIYLLIIFIQKALPKYFRRP